MKILVADDSLVVRERLINLLADLKDLEVVAQAEDAPEAVESIRRLKPDAVILDYRMPHGTGVDVLEGIKPNCVPAIVIILTNYPYPQYRQRCLEAGAHFFFDKSTEFEKVRDVLGEES